MDNSYMEEVKLINKEWVLQKLRGNKLRIIRIPLETSVPASYSMFRIKYSEKLELLRLGKWDLVDEDEYISDSLSNKENLDLKSHYFKLAKTYVSKDTRKEVHKKQISDVRGTSCLIRTSTKSYIQIAYRRNDNRTSINRVCISDTRREEFFETCRNTDDILASKYYKIRNGYKYFDYWNKFMDEEYNRQVGNK